MAKRTADRGTTEQTGQKSADEIGAAPCVDEAHLMASTVDVVNVVRLDAALVLAAPFPADRNPAAVYLASLGSDKSRTAQRSALDIIARELGGSAETLAWSALRYQHVAALRARLAARFAPATVN